MIVLGIDTGGFACSVAVNRDGETLASQITPMRHGHAQHLAPAIDRLLTTADLSPSSVDIIGVTVGPGAFTGLRVGLAAAGGLALATGARIVGVSSFKAVSAMCRPLTSDTSRLVIIDSRRAEPFIQVFAADGAVGSADWRDVSAIADEVFSTGMRLAGDGATAVAAAMPEPPTLIEATGPINPSVVCGLALANLSASQIDPPAPVYLRPPDAKPAHANTP